MTNGLSKHKLLLSVQNNCYETIHTWNPSCTGAFLDLFRESFKGSLFIFIPLYLVPHILKRDFEWSSLRSTAQKMSVSMTALTLNTSLVLGICCLFQHFTGRCFYLSPFFASFIAHFGSFWFERPSRRNALALFSTKSALEILYKIFRDFGYLQTFPESRASVLLFAASIAFNFYLAKKKGFTRDPLSTLLRLLVGKQEGAQKTPGAKETSLDSGADENKNYVDDKKKDPQSPAKSVCPHEDNCPKYVCKGFVKPFLTGWLGQAALFSLRNQSNFPFNQLLDPKALRFGLFLGGLGSIYKGVLCSLRTMTGRDEPYFGAIGGMCSGMSFTLCPSTQISLYTFWKTLYTLYWNQFGDKKGAQLAVDLAFAFADSVLINCYVMEPQYISKSYINFCDKVTGKKLRQLNIVLYYFMSNRINEWYYGDKLPNLDGDFVTNRYFELTGLWLLEAKSNFHRKVE